MSQPAPVIAARAKWISPTWIEDQLGPFPFESVYEPFCGQARLSQHFKRRGKRVIAGDLLESHYCFALALVENNRQVVPPARMQEWLTLIKDPEVATRFSAWAPSHFTPEEAIWLGVWNAHLGANDLDPITRALGAVAVHHTMRYWLSFDRTRHAHKPMSPPVAFQHYLQTVNTWVCNSGHANQALWGDAYLLAPKVEADLLFCYPPTGQGFLDYPEPLALFESWVKGDPTKALPGVEDAPQGPPTLGTPLGSGHQYTEALRRFLTRVEHIPTWAVAFNDRYPLDEPAFCALIQEFRPIVRRSTSPIATGERGPAPVERLIVAQSS